MAIAKFNVTYLNTIKINRVKIKYKIKFEYYELFNLIVLTLIYCESCYLNNNFSLNSLSQLWLVLCSVDDVKQYLSSQ